MMPLRSLMAVKWQRVTWVVFVLETGSSANEMRVFRLTHADALYFEGLVGWLG